MKAYKSCSLVCPLVAALAVAMILSLGGSTARGELIFSDSFAYPVGPLAGQGPPAGAPPGQTGWSLLNGNPVVQDNDLTFPNVFSAGGSAALSGSQYSEVMANFPPVTGGVVWLGFLINVYTTDNDGYAVVELSNGVDGAPAFGVLFETKVFGIDNNTNKRGSRGYSTVSPSVTPNWLVVKLDFDGGTESLYINPSRTTSSPQSLVPNVRVKMDPDFKAGGISQIFLNTGANDGVWGFDEVRIGTTFADVRSGN